ncbi:hypothetical protein JRO89_XS12G0076600 [Xanthoceras sorbifolium]|uniref:hAT-like transposase RNase-H fold domain-containing protein n=1 Tax=Xanthoceras sorbifolium TaxID=99658 RepID=A0ABQ8HBP3_9ROSI|nr:hypothetical protein JRO89_XS12G0076600 [Xanthoceras sorbifolium]
MAENMIRKHEHYWGVLHGVIIVATILDPRALNLCRDLIDEYALMFKMSEGPSSYGKSPSSSRLTKSICKFKKQNERMSSYDDYVNETDTTFLSKLDAYLQENVLPNTIDFDILIWWKTNAIASKSASSTGGRVVSPS